MVVLFKYTFLIVVLFYNLFSVKIGVVNIEGNNRVEKSSILSYIKFDQTKEYSMKDIDSFIKILYKKKFFSHVEITLDKDILLIKVKENPIIKNIAIEGNKKLDIKEKLIIEKLKLKPRRFFSKADLKLDTYTLKEIYNSRGFYDVKITPKKINRAQNRVDIIFEVEEGKKATIHRIYFLDNIAFQRSVLQKIIETKEDKWYRFFATDDQYDPHRLELDKEKLRNFYFNNGYLQFKINSVIAEIGVDKNFYITFSLNEGERFKYGESKVEIFEDIRNNKEFLVDIEKIVNKSIISGQWYSQKSIEKIEEEIKFFLGQKGFSFAKINIQQNFKPGNIVDLSLNIKKGKKIYIRKIFVKGNNKTAEYVIKRELLLYEGDLFDSVKIELSKRKIYNLGFFKTVNIEKIENVEESTVDIIVKVQEEETTGSMMFALGYGYPLGVSGRVLYTETNFMGEGQEVSIETEIAETQKKLGFSFTEPYFMGYNVSATAFLNSSINSTLMGKNDKGGEFFLKDTLSHTVGFSFFYYLTNNIYQLLGFKIKSENINKTINKSVSEYIKKTSGSFVSSIIDHTITYDKRDNYIEPRSGYMCYLHNEFSLGNVRYVKNTIGTKFYYPFTKKIFSVSKIKVGGIILGTRRIVDNFRLDPMDFRGFENMGAVDIKSGKSYLGGEFYYVLSNDLVFPLGLPAEWEMKGNIFMDVGSLGKITKDSTLVGKANIKDKMDIRVSIGFGMLIKSRLGPLKFTWGFPVVKTKHDTVRVFDFRLKRDF